MALGVFRQSAAKTVEVWAIEGEFDPAGLRSNTFTMEWPPRSGRSIEVPEVDRAQWFTPEMALAASVLTGVLPAAKAYEGFSNGTILLIVIAFLVARGLTDRQIALELSIPEHTAATHVGKILKKLRLSSRSQLAG